jgi:hypothetical protein
MFRPRIGLNIFKVLLLMNCLYCDNSLEEAQQKITLLCNHTAHTRCFLIESARDRVDNFMCHECNQEIISHEIYLEANPPITTTECENLAESSEEFRNGLTTIVQKYKSFKKTKNALTSKMKPIVQEYKAYIKPQLSILKGYVKSKKTLIKELEEYKQTRKELSSFKRFVTTFCLKHNINEYELRRYMRKQRLLLISSSRYYRLEYMLRKNFRIRI